MQSPTGKSILFRLVLLLGVALSVTAVGSAQVVYDWSSNSKAPESYPRITRKQKVTFTITNVNDILYSYRLEVTETPIASDDFKHITEIVMGSTGLSDRSDSEDPCSAKKDELLRAFEAAKNAINEDPKLPIGYAASKTHTSIPLSETIAAWRSHAEILKRAVKLEQAYIDQRCNLDPSSQDLIDDFKRSVLKIDEAVNGPHVFVDDHFLSPGNDVSVTIFELFKTENISSKTFTFPGTDILTLSAGALFSRIPDRSYEARKTPLATESVLTVEGNSKATPSIVGLLNYSLGGLGLDRDNVGLALSAGPVIRLGGKSDASAFGFFTGVSGHLAHRFYITPGIHFGQFSDFPVGFGNGSLVPANFGQLTPVKRWTGRFGLAITFKTKDFSGLVSSETPSVTGTEAGGTATKPKGGETGDSDAISEALSQPVRRSFMRSSRSESSDRVAAAQPQPQREFEARPSNRDNAAASSEFGGPVLLVTSIYSSMSSVDDRVSINANGSIRDYSTSFKGGRFYFVIPHARLDVIQDSLRGRAFSEPLVEKRGDDLVLSFVLAPGARVRVTERPNGLDLILISSNAN